MKRNNQSIPKPEFITRELLPKVREEGKNVILECPFCEVSHPVSIGKMSACGTQLRVMAVQVVVPKRTVHKRGIKCFKCGEGDGEMVQFNQGFAHLVNCRPDMVVMTQPPGEFSVWAERVYKLPTWIRGKVEKFTGIVRRVDEIDPQGKETGKTLGFIFTRST